MPAPTRTPDGRYIVIDGRRWRASDPVLAPDVHAELTSALGRARSAVGRARNEAERRLARDRVQLAKEGLGERGDPWWEMQVDDRLDRAQARLEQLREDD